MTEKVENANCDYKRDFLRVSSCVYKKHDTVMKENKNNYSKNVIKVCVIGLGYIGLPTASLIATEGYNVLGVDVDKNIINTINTGKIHIKEPDLDILVKSAVFSKKLKVSQKPNPADVFIIAVPTPLKDSYMPDLSYVESAIESIIPFLKKGNLVILESTSPVGTTEHILAGHIRKKGFRVGTDVYLAYCPERVLPGRILQELINNDRIIGGVNKLSAKKAADFYRKFVNGEIFLTDSKTAEMVKLCENAFRYVNIAFANELSIICEEVGINVWDVIRLANRHPRVNILNPGPGVGGHCVAVDPNFIVSSFPDKAKIIEKARCVNDYKTLWVVNKVIDCAQRFKSPVIGCLGLSYKPDIDDMRESPALKIAEMIKGKGYKVICSEPNVNKKEIKKLPILDTTKVIEESNILVLLVAHKEYRNIDFKALKNKIFIETVKL